MGTRAGLYETNVEKSMTLGDKLNHKYAFYYRMFVLFGQRANVDPVAIGNDGLPDDVEGPNPHGSLLDFQVNHVVDPISKFIISLSNMASIESKGESNIEEVEELEDDDVEATTDTKDMNREASEAQSDSRVIQEEPIAPEEPLVVERQSRAPSSLLHTEEQVSNGTRRGKIQGKCPVSTKTNLISKYEEAIGRRIS
ncbi:hypothetical protein R1flu_019987 [Riccia fluitans]|uniref:Uncharacterized protein n=1 Tax=Riccia fluitans TaxID=41844 RepID=A0ABD1ZP17_9MARC